MRHGPEFVEKLRHEHGSSANGGEYQQRPGSMMTGDSQAGSMRPSSLEIQKLSQTAQAYLTGQGTRASEYGYIFNNGPLASRQGMREQGGHQQQQQQQQHAANSQYNQGNVAGMAAQDHCGEVNTQAYREHDRMARSTSDYQARGGDQARDTYSPDARKGQAVLNQSVSSNSSNSRPSMPPPAPPMSLQQHQQVGRSSLSSLAMRETLPPPPPAPQLQDAHKQPQRTPSSVSASLAPAGPYQMSSSPKGKLRNSFELPPPPTPPPLVSPTHTADPLPTLPPPAPSFGENYNFRESDMNILPPSPPLLPPPSLGKAKSFERSRIPNLESEGELRAPPPPPSDWTDPSSRRDAAYRDDHDSTALTDDVSNSDASSVVGGGARADDGSKTDEPLIRDTRSDLLSAIREGNVTDIFTMTLQCLFDNFFTWF